MQVIGSGRREAPGRTAELPDWSGFLPPPIEPCMRCRVEQRRATDGGLLAWPQKGAEAGAPPLFAQTRIAVRLLHPPVERLVRFSLKPLSDSVHRQHYDAT